MIARFLLLLVACLILEPLRLPSCGPFLPAAVFTFRTHPLLPWEAYLSGNLGVIQPSYRRKFLFVAYRYLEGNPLSSAQQSALATNVQGPDLEPARDHSDGLKTWLEARAKVNGQAPEKLDFNDLFSKVPGSDWQQFQNCLPDAFEAAAATLEDRLRRFGPRHPALRTWVEAQDQVFSNCSGPGRIPAPAGASLPEIIRRDRAYQVAAALFYAGDYSAARQRFQEIAGDPKSPWQPLARYLVARTHIREATLAPAQGAFDPVRLEAARRELRQILDDPSLRVMHSAARRLGGYIEARLDPAGRLLALAQALETGEGGDSFTQSLTDYLYLLDRFPRMDREQRAAIRRTSAMTDWILAVQARGGHAVEQWRRTPSAPWLVAALIATGPGDPAADELLQAAAAVPRDSPAYETVLFHRVRLLTGLGTSNSARALLDRELPRLRRSAPLSSLNLFLSQRLTLARDLDEFLRLAPRRPSGVTEFGEWSAMSLKQTWRKREIVRSPVLFDADSVKVFNQGLPLASLRRAALHPLVPSSLREHLLRAVWVRAVLLQDEEVDEALSPALLKSYPALAPYLERLQQAGTPAARRFAAADLMLRFPGFKPYLRSGLGLRTRAGRLDKYRDNWWCAAQDDMDRPGLTLFWQANSPDFKPARPAPAPPPFLSEQERRQLSDQLARLADLGPGPDYLARTVLEWARANPDDPRVPEALHLAVRATRYGCTGPQTATYSRRAFELLHTRYPGSRWAKATPYWFR